MTRVEIALAAPSEHEVTAGPEGVVIALTAASVATASAQDSVDARRRRDGRGDRARAKRGRGRRVDRRARRGRARRAGAAARPCCSRRRRARGRRGLDDPPESDGSVDSAQTFTLEDPARLVIDLPGMKSQVAKQHDRGRLAAGRARARGQPRRQGARGGRRRIRQRLRSRAAAWCRVPTGLVVALGADPELDAAVGRGVRHRRPRLRRGAGRDARRSPPAEPRRKPARGRRR